MPAYRERFTDGTWFAALIAASMFAFGCSTATDAPNSRSARGIDSAPGPAADARVVAWVDGAAVHAADLHPAFIDRAGVEALTEVILDRRLDSEFASRGLSIGDTEVDQERQHLMETLSGDQDEATRLLQELRDRQALGDNRFHRLLRRNAMLRAVVAPDVRVSDQDLRRTYELLHGEKRVARVIVCRRMEAAEAIARRLDNGESFADVATETSTDASAARGGLLPPISHADPTWPSSLRESLWRLNPGDRSEPLMLRQEFMIIRLERVVPRSEVDFELERPLLEQTARRMHERVLMEEFARRCVEEARVTIADDALARAWEARRGP